MMGKRTRAASSDRSAPSAAASASAVRRSSDCIFRSDDALKGAVRQTSQNR